jgi:hypothetical protein
LFSLSSPSCRRQRVPHPTRLRYHSICRYGSQLQSFFLYINHHPRLNAGIVRSLPHEIWKQSQREARIHHRLTGLVQLLPHPGHTSLLSPKIIQILLATSYDPAHFRVLLPRTTFSLPRSPKRRSRMPENNPRDTYGGHGTPSSFSDAISSRRRRSRRASNRITAISRA